MTQQPDYGPWLPPSTGDPIDLDFTLAIARLDRPWLVGASDVEVTE